MNTPLLKRLNHVAIAVPDAKKAAALYAQRFCVTPSAPEVQPEHGVTTIFVTLSNVLIEFLEPLGDSSPIINFLARHPEGGIHHLCFEVENVDDAISHLTIQGVRVLGGGEAKIGAHGKPVVFLHPKDCFGTLMELEGM